MAEKVKNKIKNDKIFRIINLIIMSLLCITCIIFAFYYGFVSDPNSRIIPSICIAVLSLVPLFIELIFRKKFNNIVFLAIEIYLIFAGLIGSVLNVYYLVAWYDIIIHTLMGYLVALCGIFVISRIGNYKKMNAFLVATFCLCFSLAIEVLWELFEWGADNLFNQTMQGEKIVGYGEPLVGDTMLDLLCNTIGSFLFFIHFIVGRTTKFSLGIKFLEKQLVKENDALICMQRQLTDTKKNIDIDEEESIKNINKNKREKKKAKLNDNIEAKKEIKDNGD